MSNYEVEIYKTIWYLAYQDGRADNIDYNSYEEAKAAFDRIGDKSTCIRSERKRVTLDTILIKEPGNINGKEV